MKCKSKTMLAVFAVCLMLGGALLPLASDDSNGLIVEQSADQDGEFGLSDFIGMLSAMTHNDEEITPSGSMFIPVDGGEVGAQALPGAEISAETSVTEGMEIHLGGNQTYTFTGDGKYVVEDGGKIVLSDFNNDNDGFTLKNTGHNYKNVIVLKNGALINFFGIWFKFVCVGNDALPLVTLGHYTDATFGNVKTSNVKEIYIDVNANKVSQFSNKLVIFGLITVCSVNDNSNLKEIDIKGNISVSSGTILFTDCTLTVVLATQSYDSGKLASNTTVSIELEIDSATATYTTWDYSTSPTKASFDVTFTGTGKLEKATITIDSVDSTDYIISLESMTGSGDDPLTFSIGLFKYSAESKLTKSGDNIEKTNNSHKFVLDKIQIAGDAKLGLSSTDPKNSVMYIDDLDLSLSNLSVVFKTYGDSTATEYTSFELKSVEFSFCVSAESIESSRWEYVGFSIEISNVKFNFDSQNLSVGTFKIVSDIVSEGYLKNTLHLVIEVPDVGADENGYYATVKARLSTMFDGSERSMNLTVKNFRLNLNVSSLLDDAITCDYIKITNDIPINKIVYPDVASEHPALRQSYVGSLELRGISSSLLGFLLAGINVESFSFSMDVLDYGIADHFDLYSNEECIIPILSIFSSEGEFDLSKMTLTVYSKHAIYGYLKNVGEDKRAFKITPNDDNDYAQVTFKIQVDSDDTVMLIQSADADFTQGGLIPAKLVIGSYAKLNAKDLSAVGFKFECPFEDVSGTIMFDFNDGFDMDSRSIEYNDANGNNITTNVFKTVAGFDDCGGYRIVFSLSDLRTGKIYANSGCYISNSSQKSDEFITFIIRDNGKTVDFAISDSNPIRDVWVNCQRNTYDIYTDFTVEGGTTHQFGETVTVSGEYETQGSNFVLIGWADGNNNIVGTVDKNNNTVTATFTMPARDVYLVPVYAEKGTVSEDNVVETSATAVVIPVDEISTYKDLTIKTNGAKIKIDSNTVEVLTEGAEEITINVIPLLDADSTSKSAAVQNNAVFNIEVLVDGEEYELYNENTSFEVTLTVYFEGNIKDFKISCLDEFGHKSDVKLTSFKSYGNNLYDVKFKVNHFSEYMVEPVFKTKVDPVAVGFVTAVLMIALAVGIYQYCRPGKI